jgi:hypothetical protein
MIFNDIVHESRLKLDIPREISKQVVVRTIKKFSAEFAHSLRLFATLTTSLYECPLSGNADKRQYGSKARARCCQRPSLSVSGRHDIKDGIRLVQQREELQQVQLAAFDRDVVRK